ncbi:MAG: hypothetical protein HUJ65_03480, partial [Oscillospiraceae bacterium]|nr:hypothetical protein [Oscillospiraceae bacterium]
ATAAIEGQKINVVAYEDYWLRANGFTVNDVIPCDAPLPESAHNYANSIDETVTYDAGTDPVVISFSADTATEKNYDFIYIYDADDNEIGKYTGTELAGKGVLIPTGVFKIRLTSDSSSNAYGYKVTKIVTHVPGDLTQAIAEIELPLYVITGDPLPKPVVKYNGEILEEGVDYTLEYPYEDTSLVGSQPRCRANGIGDYSGYVQAWYTVLAADGGAAAPAQSSTSPTLIRLSGPSGSTSVKLTGLTKDYISRIDSITLTPVEADGVTPTPTEGLTYPNAPKEITLTKEDMGVKWNADADAGTISFMRSASEPIVYVMEGHEPIEITGRWSTNVYPQSQKYILTVKAYTYQDLNGELTYYTGTAPDFSIIIDEDGSADTTDDQTVVK